ncbi:MAG: hypothetical protein Ct9H300mP25_11610 [Acidobacteriota bacterium]|nr:MAG: hypothetical protein Ct9H300mP25_11610 [Acidobacteriota bacterium]
MSTPQTLTEFEPDAIAAALEEFGRRGFTLARSTNGSTSVALLNFFGDDRLISESTD